MHINDNLERLQDTRVAALDFEKRVFFFFCGGWRGRLLLLLFFFPKTASSYKFCLTQNVQYVILIVLMILDLRVMPPLVLQVCSEQVSGLPSHHDSYFFTELLALHYIVYTKKKKSSDFLLINFLSIADRREGTAANILTEHKATN